MERTILKRCGFRFIVTKTWPEWDSELRSLDNKSTTRPQRHNNTIWLNIILVWVITLFNLAKITKKGSILFKILRCSSTKQPVFLAEYFDLKTFLRHFAFISRKPFKMQITFQCFFSFFFVSEINKFLFREMLYLEFVSSRIEIWMSGSVFDRSKILKIYVHHVYTTCVFSQTLYTRNKRIG